MSVRAKFRVTKITEHAGNTAKQFELMAVTADDVEENRRFHKYTPSAVLTMSIDNPPAAEQFKIGAIFYVDFTPVES